MDPIQVIGSIVLPVVALGVAVLGIVLAVSANKKADRSLEYTETADARAREKNHVVIEAAVDFDDGRLTLTNSGTGDALEITGTVTTAGNDHEGRNSIDGQDLMAGESLVLDAPEAHSALIKLHGEQIKKRRAEQRRRDQQSSSDPIVAIRARPQDMVPAFDPPPVEFHVWWDLSWSTPAGNSARDADGHERIVLPGQ